MNRGLMVQKCSREDLQCILIPNLGIVPIDVEIGGAALLALSR
jgi:hypothetical protein